MRLLVRGVGMRLVPMAARTYGALAIGYYSQHGYAACPPLTRHPLQQPQSGKYAAEPLYNNSLWQALLLERAAIGHLNPKNNPSRRAATQIQSQLQNI